MTADGVRSRHGLTFFPRAALAGVAPELDRLVVPGAEVARRGAAGGLELPEGLAPVYLHDQPGFGFDGALRDIARTRDVATARWVAKTLQHPTSAPRLSGPAWPWALPLRPVLIAAAAIAAVLGIQYYAGEEDTMREQIESFPTDPAGLPEAGRPELLELAAGDTLKLRVGPVAMRLGDATVRMLGYNGSVPGPTLRVAQGAEIIVQVVNQGDLDTTVHWHGLRLENRYDGVPHETQAPIPVGGSGVGRDSG